MEADQVSKAFGRVLRAQRNLCEMSQESLALTAEIDRSYVSQLERGIRQPTLTTLYKLAAALEIQAATLVARTERLLR